MSLAGKGFASGLFGFLVRVDPLVTETYFDNLGLLPRAIEGDDHSSQLSPAAGASGDAGSEGDYESVSIKAMPVRIRARALQTLNLN